MSIMDEIMDIAQELAEQRILNDPTDAEIVDAINDCTGRNMACNSIGGKLAIATYNRYDPLNLEMKWRMSA